MAHLNDLIVNGVARFLGTVKGTIEKAISDGNGNNIASTYTPKNSTIVATKGSSKSTADGGDWTAMCNSTSTGSPTLPTTSAWWNIISLDNWGSAPNNWVSQLAIPTQNGSNLYIRRNDSGGTSINSSTWYKVANYNDIGPAAINAVKTVTSKSYTITSNSTSITFNFYKLPNGLKFMQWSSSNFQSAAYTSASGYVDSAYRPTITIYVGGMNKNYDNTGNNNKGRFLALTNAGQLYIYASYVTGFWGSAAYF